MPVIGAFCDAESFYATLAHESTHWTKYPSRLDRSFGRKSWGDERYAREELGGRAGKRLPVYRPVCTASVQSYTREQSTEQALMRDPERIRAIAAALLEKPADDSSIDRAAQLLKLASETENQSAQAAKYAAEEQKLKDDLVDARAHRRSQDIIALTPLFTTVVLAGTLALQSYQLYVQRHESKDEAQRQAETAKAEHRRLADAFEAAQWNEAIRVLSNNKQLSPAGVLLATFKDSHLYRDRGYDMAEQLLTNSTSLKEFSTAFSDVFEPVTWDNLHWVLDADRSVKVSEDQIDRRIWVPKNRKNDERLLTDPAERRTYEQLKAEILIFCARLGPLLKGPRPKGAQLDLSATGFWFCNWKGANLSAADLSGAYIYGVDLDGANLSGITQFAGADFTRSNWWNAATISRKLREYLEEKNPHRPAEYYGSEGRIVPPADYQAGLAQLKRASGL